MANPDLSGLLSCTYGTSAFQVESYGVVEAAVVREGIGRVGTRAEIAIEGYIDAPDAGTLQTTITSTLADLEIDGRDLIIKGLNGTPEYQLLGARCLNGSPHMNWELKPGNLPLRKSIRIVCTAEIVVGGGPLDSFKTTVQIRPDGLVTYTRSGEILWVTALDTFISSTLPSFRNAYPLPKWVVDAQYEYSLTGTQSKVDYRLTARQNLNPLPADSSTDFSVDGSASKQVQIDEQNRKTTVYDFDLLVIGDPMKLMPDLKPSQFVLRHSVSLETIRENRLRASFTVLESADGTSPLMNWTETYRIQRPVPIWEQKTYIGAAPILVMRPAEVGKVIQSGSATGQGVFKKPGSPRYSFFSAEPETTLTDQNAVEKQTQWSWSMWGVDAAAGPIPALDFEQSLDPIQLGRAQQDNNFYSQLKAK